MHYNLTYAMEDAKRSSGEHMATVYVHEIRSPGRRYYEVSFSPESLIAEATETAMVKVVYHDGRCIKYND